MTYVFDVDGTICSKTDGEYGEAKPIQERIDRLQGYYDDPNNGLNKCFIVQKIKELKRLINITRKKESV